jgi:hypothetical protein
MEPDYLLLADRAEVVQGKLYLIGGGWDRIGLVTLPGPADFDVAVGVLVGYHETNAPHRLEIQLEDEDNNLVAGPIRADIELGRPPGLRDGHAQRFQMVLRGPFALPRTGSYHWALSLDGERRALASFQVERVQVQAPGPIPGQTGQ